MRYLNIIYTLYRFNCSSESLNSAPIVNIERTFQPISTCVFFLFFRKMLAAGSSEPWPQILYKLSKERELRVDAMLQYFGPLLKWLKSYRKEMKYPIGWKTTETFTKRSQAALKEVDKPIILTNSSKMGLSYLRAVAKASNANNPLTGDKSNKSKQMLDDFKTLSSISSETGLKSSMANTQSRSILGPLGQAKSSILTRPVFMPSTGKEPLTLVGKLDSNNAKVGNSPT